MKIVRTIFTPFAQTVKLLYRNPRNYWIKLQHLPKDIFEHVDINKGGKL